MPLANDDTIVAVSSPPGRAARGLVRISGPQTRAVLSHLLAPHSATVSSLFNSPRRLTPVTLSLSRSPSALTLPCLACGFASPHTFTSQDMAELQLPGNPALLERVIHAIITPGNPGCTGTPGSTKSIASTGTPRARLAEPGEFTFRAFLAGKLDLTQAEGVAATIAATSDAQLQAAALLREGTLGRFAAELVDALATQLALVEAGIDFVDQDDVVPIAPAALLRNLAGIGSQLDETLRNSRAWGAIEALPRVVLVGAPSAGKSTLFNALLGRTRAVISPQPGTTRDALAEPLTLTLTNGRRVEVMLIDIAGLDAADGLLNREAQAAANRAIADADMLLLVSESDNPPKSGATGRRYSADQCLPPREEHWAAKKPTSSTPIASLKVRTKIDRSPLASPELPCDAAVSAITGAGLDDLRRAIASRIGERGVSLAAEKLALQPRHDQSLRSAATHLAEAHQLLTPQANERAIQRVELIASALRRALDDLAGLGGQMSPDDVIGKVFATFCVGK